MVSCIIFRPATTCLSFPLVSLDSLPNVHEEETQSEIAQKSFFVISGEKEKFPLSSSFLSSSILLVPPRTYHCYLVLLCYTPETADCCVIILSSNLLLLYYCSYHTVNPSCLLVFFLFSSITATFDFSSSSSAFTKSTPPYARYLPPIFNSLPSEPLTHTHTHTQTYIYTAHTHTYIYIRIHTCNAHITHPNPPPFEDPVFFFSRSLGLQKGYQV